MVGNPKATLGPGLAVQGLVALRPAVHHVARTLAEGEADLEVQLKAQPRPTGRAGLGWSWKSKKGKALPHTTSGICPLTGHPSTQRYNSPVAMWSQGGVGQFQTVFSMNYYNVGQHTLNKQFSDATSRKEVITKS